MKNRKRILANYYREPADSEPQQDETSAVFHKLDSNQISDSALINELVKTKSLQELIGFEAQLAREIKQLDSTIHSQVYKNYNSFIGAKEVVNLIQQNIDTLASDAQRLDALIDGLQTDLDLVKAQTSECRAAYVTNYEAREQKKRMDTIMALPAQLMELVSHAKFIEAIQLYEQTSLPLAASSKNTINDGGSLDVSEHDSVLKEMKRQADLALGLCLERLYPMIQRQVSEMDGSRHRMLYGLLFQKHEHDHVGTLCVSEHAPSAVQEAGHLIAAFKDIMKNMTTLLEQSKKRKQRSSNAHVSLIKKIFAQLLVPLNDKSAPLFLLLVSSWISDMKTQEGSSFAPQNDVSSPSSSLSLYASSMASKTAGSAGSAGDGHAILHSPSQHDAASARASVGRANVVYLIDEILLPVQTAIDHLAETSHEHTALLDWACDLFTQIHTCFFEAIATLLPVKDNLIYLCPIVREVYSRLDIITRATPGHSDNLDPMMHHDGLHQLAVSQFEQGYIATLKADLSAKIAACLSKLVDHAVITHLVQEDQHPFALAHNNLSYVHTWSAGALHSLLRDVFQIYEPFFIVLNRAMPAGRQRIESEFSFPVFFTQLRHLTIQIYLYALFMGDVGHLTFATKGQRELGFLIDNAITKAIQDVNSEQEKASRVASTGGNLGFFLVFSLIQSLFRTNSHSLSNPSNNNTATCDDSSALLLNESYPNFKLNLQEILQAANQQEQQLRQHGSVSITRQKMLIQVLYRISDDISDIIFNACVRSLLEDTANESASRRSVENGPGDDAPENSSVIDLLEDSLLELCGKLHGLFDLVSQTLHAFHAFQNVKDQQHAPVSQTSNGTRIHDGPTKNGGFVMVRAVIHKSDSVIYTAPSASTQHTGVYFEKKIRHLFTTPAESSHPSVFQASAHAKQDLGYLEQKKPGSGSNSNSNSNSAGDVYTFECLATKLMEVDRPLEFIILSVASAVLKGLAVLLRDTSLDNCAFNNIEASVFLLKYVVFAFSSQRSLVEQKVAQFLHEAIHRTIQPVPLSWDQLFAKAERALLEYYHARDGGSGGAMEA